MIRKDDIIDVYIKLRQRGLSFLSSKVNFNQQARTKSAFNDDKLFAAHWWIIPQVKRRWNKMITNDPNQDYESYLVSKYFSNHSNLKMLSIGSGVCSHEMKLAEYKVFEEITCVDIADKLLHKAGIEADKRGLRNMRFKVGDVYNMKFEKSTLDVIFFHASLHHFNNIESLIKDQLYDALKPGGLFVINEYVGANRMQFPKVQIEAINEAISIIPPAYRTRYVSQTVKNQVSGPGRLRMIVADPSECVDSESILPSLRRHFIPLVEKPYGGNILMYALKDISHHFVEPTEEKASILEQLFVLEDTYLKKHESDFMFGVYQKPFES